MPSTNSTIAYLSGQRTLADHRFWKFVLSVAEARNLAMPADVSLEIYPDEDGLLQFKIDVAGKSDGKSVHSTLQSAVEAVGKLGASNLRKVADAGYVVFKRVGTARWSAVPRFSDCRGEVKVGLSRRLAAAVGSKLGRLRSSGDWSMTIDPVPIAKVEDALRRLLAKGEMPSIISGVTVTGGVRTDHHWLGRRTLLPKIETDLGLPTIDAEGEHGRGVAGLRGDRAQSVRYQGRTPARGRLRAQRLRDDRDATSVRRGRVRSRRAAARRTSSRCRSGMTRPRCGRVSPSRRRIGTKFRSRWTTFSRRSTRAAAEDGASPISFRCWRGFFRPRSTAGIFCEACRTRPR